MSDNNNYVIMKKGSEPNDLEKEVFERILRLMPILTNSKHNLVDFDFVMLSLYSKKCETCILKRKIETMLEKLKKEE